MLIFCTVSQGLVTIAFYVLEASIVLFTKYVMRQTNAEAESTFSLWMGTVYLCSLAGGFLSDYLGRYLISIYAQVFLTVVSKLPIFSCPTTL